MRRPARREAERHQSQAPAPDAGHRLQAAQKICPKRCICIRTGPDDGPDRAGGAGAGVPRGAAGHGEPAPGAIARVRLDEDSWLVLDGRETCSVRLDPDRRTRMLAVVVSPDDVQAALASLRDVAGWSGRRSQAAGAQDPVLARSARLARRARLRRQPAPARRPGRPPPAGDRRRRVRPRDPIPTSACSGIALVRDACAGRTSAAPEARRASTASSRRPASSCCAASSSPPTSSPAATTSRSRSTRWRAPPACRAFISSVCSAWSTARRRTPSCRRKRTAVARRHLAVGGACSEAASRAGFGSRSSLFRNLRRVGARRRRHRAMLPLCLIVGSDTVDPAGLHRGFDGYGFKPYAVDTFSLGPRHDPAVAFRCRDRRRRRPRRLAAPSPAAAARPAHAPIVVVWSDGGERRQIRGAPGRRHRGHRQAGVAAPDRRQAAPPDRDRQATGRPSVPKPRSPRCSSGRCGSIRVAPPRASATRRWRSPPASSSCCCCWPRGPASSCIARRSRGPSAARRAAASAGAAPTCTSAGSARSCATPAQCSLRVETVYGRGYCLRLERDGALEKDAGALSAVVGLRRRPFGRRDKDRERDRDLGLALETAPNCPLPREPQVGGTPHEATPSACTRREAVSVTGSRPQLRRKPDL